MNNSNTPIILAAVFSGLLHLGGIYQLSDLGQVKSIDSLSQKTPQEIVVNLKPALRENYIDTELESKKNDNKSDFISDKSSKADSSKFGTETGVLPASDFKDLLSQAQRSQMEQNLTPAELFTEIQKQKEKIDTEEKNQRIEEQLKDKISVLEKVEVAKESTKEEKPKEQTEEEKEIEEIKDMNLSLAQKESIKKDVFSLPLISIGSRTLSEEGIDAFEARESDLGKYIKTVRDKLGLNFNQMIFFHYKSSYILETKVETSFYIRPDGKIENLETKLVKGDPIFLEYCKSVVTSSSPFGPFSEKLKPFLEENGMLKMDILFGNNIRKSEDS